MMNGELAAAVTQSTSRMRVGPGLDQVVRSAAHAAGCPVAAFFFHGTDGFTLGASYGLGPLGSEAIDNRVLAAAIKGDGLYVINDLSVEPDLPAADGEADGERIRFVASVRVLNGIGGSSGLLVVADLARRAGLSAAQTYVLRTHGAQISVLLELFALRRQLDGEQPAPQPRVDTERLRLLESVVVNANDAVLITEAEPIDLPGPRIVYCNAAFTRTTGYAEADVLGLTPRILQGPNTDRAALDRLRLALSRWEPIEIELLNRRKNGEEFWVELSIVPVANEVGWYTHWVSVQRDVSDRKQAEETVIRARFAAAENVLLEQEIRDRKRVEAQLSYAAFHDDLTKLSNRAYFMNRLNAALVRTGLGPGNRCAVLFMDLDRFKLVNDSLGHRAGDLLLMEVAHRLRGCARPQDTLARIGGDEFVLLMEDEGEVSAAAVETAERILAAMRQPIWLGKQEIFSSCSVGVVLEMGQYTQAEELMRDADTAMYQAKRTETGSYTVFAASMRADAVAALSLQTDLRNALGRGEFILHYQPICNALTGAITGVEALVRWQHPQRGLVAPGGFITVAEETGLIREIGRWVLAEACAQMRRWRDRFPRTSLQLSVNSSGVEFQDRRFFDGVQAVLADTALDPRLLQIEVTESVLLQQPERVDAILGRIRALGVRVALDDFGTGYSSLSYLDRYALDAIKIDRSFVAQMLTRPSTRAIVDTIIALGQALELDIVAEGVETEMQLQALRAAGCGFVQGYLLGRPMTVEQVEAVLAGQGAGLPV